MPVIIEPNVEGSIDIPEFPLDGVIDLLQALTNKAKEEIFDFGTLNWPSSAV
jgi:hypothetical protein